MQRVRAIAWASLAAQIGIIVTGGAVRLTGSGLGCPTWPRCTPETYVVVPSQGIHGMIEFGNRMLTFVLAAVAVAALASVWNLRRERPDLFRLAWWLLLGIPAQAVLGGLTVLTGLNPWLVGAHFWLSAVLVAIAAVFVYRTLPAPAPVPAWVHGNDAPPVPTAFRTLTTLAAAAAGVALTLGVVVTGAGPHAGDAATPRNGLELEWLQHLHSVPGYAMLALTLWLAVVVERARLVRGRMLVLGLLLLELLQVLIGVAQARTGVPPLLVGTHMLLAGCIVAAMTGLVLVSREQPTLRPASPR